MMPTIRSQRHNSEEWTVELDCPGWQDGFLQVELQADARTNPNS